MIKRQKDSLLGALLKHFSEHPMTDYSDEKLRALVAPYETQKRVSRALMLLRLGRDIKKTNIKVYKPGSKRFSCTWRKVLRYDFLYTDYNNF